MTFSIAQFQTFPPSEGYPFPTFIGSCGRFTAVEYVGPTLDKYYDAAWEERVSSLGVCIFSDDIFVTDSSQRENMYR